MCSRCFLLMLLTGRFHERCCIHFIRTLTSNRGAVLLSHTFSMIEAVDAFTGVLGDSCRSSNSGQHPLIAFPVHIPILARGGNYIVPYRVSWSSYARRLRKETHFQRIGTSHRLLHNHAHRAMSQPYLCSREWI